MTLVDLGLRTLDVDSGWVEFQPFRVKGDKSYLIFLDFSTTGFEQVYSTFELSNGYTIQDSTFAYTMPVQLVNHTLSPIAVVIHIPDKVDKDQDQKIAMKRTPIWSQPSALKSIQVAAFLEEDETLD